MKLYEINEGSEGVDPRRDPKDERPIVAGDLNNGFQEANRTDNTEKWGNGT